MSKSEPDACRKFYIGSIGKSMHWYKRNIGDYAKKAGRLTMLQHGSYTLLMDACYDRERFPTLEQAIEWTWASTSEEVESLKFVLAKFFTLGGDGVYTQERILEELLDYHSKADKNKQIAIDRETKRRENSTNRTRPVHEAPPNQEPVTSNHKPITKEPVVTAAKRRQQLPSDFEPNESGKRKAVDKGLSCVEELIKFQDYHRGKGSLMADWQAAWRTWIGNARPPNITQTETAYQRSMRERVDQAIGRNRVYDPDPQFLEIEQ